MKKAICFAFAAILIFVLFGCTATCDVCGKTVEAENINKTSDNRKMCNECYHNYTMEIVNRVVANIEEREKKNETGTLKPHATELDDDYPYTYVDGYVENTGKNTYKFVKVKARFKDGDIVVDTNDTYAVGSEGLEPGERSKFHIFVDYDADIDNVEVTVYDWDVD